MKQVVILNSKNKKHLMSLDVNVLNAKPKRLINSNKVMILTDDITGLVSEYKKVFKNKFICTTIRLRDYEQNGVLYPSYVYFISKNNREWKRQYKILSEFIEKEEVE